MHDTISRQQHIPKEETGEWRRRAGLARGQHLGFWLIEISFNIIVILNYKGCEKMSYCVHITKAHHWIFSENNPITAEELLKVSDLMDTYKGVPFQYFDGRITLDGADERVIGLMIEMANRIVAKVQGDEGEYYNNKDNKYPMPPDYLKEEQY